MGCTRFPETAPADAELALVCERWEALPDKVRADIVALAKSAQEKA